MKLFFTKVLIFLLFIGNAYSQADESILDAAKRKIVFENLEIGTYSYTIQAVSASGVLSALSSQSRIFKVEEKY